MRKLKETTSLLPIEDQTNTRLAIHSWRCCSGCDSSIFSWGGTTNKKKLRAEVFFDIKFKILRIFNKLNCFCFGDTTSSVDSTDLEPPQPRMFYKPHKWGEMHW